LISLLGFFEAKELKNCNNADVARVVTMLQLFESHNNSFSIFSTILDSISYKEVVKTKSPKKKKGQPLDEIQEPPVAEENPDIKKMHSNGLDLLCRISSLLSNPLYVNIKNISTSVDGKVATVQDMAESFAAIPNFDLHVFEFLKDVHQFYIKNAHDVSDIISYHCH
jgi:hypothetical protein